MPEQKILDGVKYKYKGLLDFSELYKTMFNFFDSRGYDIVEKEHSEEINDDGSRNIKIKWECELKVTDYIKYKYSITLEASNLKKVIVNTEEGKKEMDYGEISLEVTAVMDTYYSKYFEDNPKKWLIRSLLENYIWVGELKEAKKKLFKEGYTFLDTIKELTNSYKFLS